MKAKKRARPVIAATDGAQGKTFNTPQDTKPNPARQAAREKRAEEARTSVDDAQAQEETLPPEEQIEKTVRYLEAYLNSGGDLTVEARSWTMCGQPNEHALPPKPDREVLWEVLCPEGIHHLISGSRFVLGSGLITVDEASEILGLSVTAVHLLRDYNPMHQRWLGGDLFWRKKFYVSRWKVRELERLFGMMRHADSLRRAGGSAAP